MSTYAVTVRFKYSASSSMTFEYSCDVEAATEKEAAVLAGIRMGTNMRISNVLLQYVGIVKVPESELQETKGDA